MCDAEEEATRCVACEEVIVKGDLVYVETGEGAFIHADCCGDDPESFADSDGNPLKPNDPIPAPFPFAG
jgi:hypothetical protein